MYVYKPLWEDRVPAGVASNAGGEDVTFILQNNIILIVTENYLRI
jgi:hypothetical protein